jgi:Xaa-Pro aminopeptidase
MRVEANFSKRLAQVRRRMDKAGVNAFLVPSADAFQGEYVPASDRRLTWISGFTGSMGNLLITKRQACLFVDGRYTLQAGKEADPALFTIIPSALQSPAEWVERHLKPGQTLGIDPWLITDNGARTLEEACRKAQASLKLLDGNPIDQIWTDRPAPPVLPVWPHALDYAGESGSAKRGRVAAKLRDKGTDALLITAPESLCWLLNIRGADVPHAPLVRAFALLHRDASVDLFLEPERLKLALDQSVRLIAPDHLIGRLQELGSHHQAIWIDPKQTPLILSEGLKFAGAKITNADDPILLMRACKNPVEIAGARSAHRRDGLALVRFLSGLRAGGRESDAAKAVDAERAKEPLSQGPSFDTIAAFGANGAIVHYRAKPKQDAKLKPGGLFLLDSGGQYLDGTTDVTRTVFIGPGRPTAEMKQRFTLVLKGHIALATAIFPKGTSGGQLDILARQFLWRAGLDYDHGTGHGVGSFLSVHEGPQRISKAGGQAVLEEGMILSIEPGYYKANAYGIRIESLALVVPAPKTKADERDMLAFEILTMVPIDRRLIAPGLLTKSERYWLNAYQQRVRSALRGKLNGAARGWLERATVPL